MIHHDLDLIYDIYDTINDTIKDKVTTSHWCFQSNMTSIKKWCKEVFHNFICVIINHTFYFITLWMHYTLFISVFRRNEIYCYSQLKFLCIRFFWTIYVFQVWSTFIKIFFNWSFITITITFVFNTIVAPKFSYTYWFIMIFFLCSKRFLVSVTLSFIASLSFFSLKGFIISLMIAVEKFYWSDWLKGVQLNC